MKINEAIERFGDYIAHERRLAQGTVRNYLDDLADFATFAAELEVVEVEQLDSRLIRDWQMSHTERGEAVGTVRRRLSSVSSWARFMRRRGYCEVDLMARVSLPKLPKHLPVFYRESEVEHLYDEGLFGDDFIGRRDRLLLRMLYETGIRRSELVGLREGSVDTVALTLKVRGKRNKERMVPIEVELAHNISEYIALKRQEVGDVEWLFVNRHGRQMGVQEVYRVVKRYMTALSSADRISPHVFRHSFATHILSNGGDMVAVKELLGHENLATTEVYTHVTREHLKEVYGQAHPRGRKR